METAWKATTHAESILCNQGKRATEPPFTGEYEDTQTAGNLQVCFAAAQPLFSFLIQNTTQGSGVGPVFYAPASEEAVEAEGLNTSHGMRRTEVKCSRCDAHLGHLF